MLRLYGRETTTKAPRKQDHLVKMMPNRETSFDVTISSLKHLAIWDEGETSSPLMDRTNGSLNTSDHSSSSSMVSTPHVYSPRRAAATSKGTSQPFLEYELKNTRDVLVGSISAVINFLGSSGVPKPACDQLHKNLEMGRYFAVLKRVQDYILCLPSLEEDDILAKIHFSVGAWEALCRFKAIEYKRAYKYCFNLRYEMGGTPHDIKSAIDMQVKIAEQCTTCQKNLYLVQKWQRHLLNKMKRTTMIQPEGYQPIRCL